MIALALKLMLLKIETFLSQFQTLWLLAFLFWHLVQFSFFGGVVVIYHYLAQVCP